MKKLNPTGIALALSAVLAPITAHAVNPCYIDNSTGASYATPLQLGTTHNPGAGQIACGHTVSGSGCTVEQSTDLTFGSTCLTIGKGVDFDGKGHNLHCTTNTDCSSPAIVVGSTTPAGSGGSTVGNVSLSGCWVTAIRHQNTNSATAEDVTIDFPTSGCSTGAKVGILDFNTVTRATISNADTAGIKQVSNNSSSINDSVITDCAVGVQVSGVTGTKLVNGRLDGNTQSISAGTGSYDVESQGSAFSNASSGHCGSGSSLTCIEFSGTRSSFVDFVIK